MRISHHSYKEEITLNLLEVNDQKDPINILSAANIQNTPSTAPLREARFSCSTGFYASLAAFTIIGLVVDILFKAIQPSDL